MPVARLGLPGGGCRGYGLRASVAGRLVARRRSQSGRSRGGRWWALNLNLNLSLNLNLPWVSPSPAYPASATDRKAAR